MQEWKKVTSNDFDTMTSVAIDTTNICIIRYEDKLYALEDCCSHEHAKLSEGDFDGGLLYCPKHGASFDVATGNPRTLPATSSVRTFEVKADQEGVYILWDT